MNANGLRFLMLSALAVFFSLRAVCQTAFPEVLDKGTLSDQMKYLEEKTRIYENYRAIREDMFQKIKVNTLDTLISAKTRISGLVGLTGTLNARIDSLNNSLTGKGIASGNYKNEKQH